MFLGNKGQIGPETVNDDLNPCRGSRSQLLARQQLNLIFVLFQTRLDGSRIAERDANAVQTLEDPDLLLL